MFVTNTPARLPFVASNPEPRVAAPQPVKAPTFAKLLDQSQRQTPQPSPRPNPGAAHPAPPPAVKAPVPAPATADAGASAAPTDDANTPTAGRTRATTADKARKPASASTAKSSSHDDDHGKADANADDTSPAASDTPALAHTMSHLAHPTGQPTADALAATADDAAAASAAETAGLDARGRGDEYGAVSAAGERGTATDRAQADPAESMRTDAAASMRADAADEAATQRGNGMATGHDAAAAFTLPIDAGTALLPTASAFAMHAAAGTTRSSEPATAVVIATRVTAPEFPQALGVQLSVLAERGIQHAELHLNPADMGPVSVQIEMNGNQAHIDFGADLAATRQAIEAGLPELASALRDAGFTLSGGGVSQHPRGGSEPGADDARRVGRAARIGTDAIDGIASPPAAVQRQRTLGGLDLYA